MRRGRSGHAARTAAAAPRGARGSARHRWLQRIESCLAATGASPASLRARGTSSSLPRTLTRAATSSVAAPSLSSRLVLVVLLCATTVRAQLKILEPDSLAEEFAQNGGVVYGTTATFGAPYYGVRVTGRLFYSEGKGGKHCKASDYDLPVAPRRPDTEEAAKEPKWAIVVLVERGICTFVTKVQVAQDKGAHAVVLVDTEGSTRTEEDIQKVVMADDGYGASVKIPTMMVSRPEGQKLIDAVRSGVVLVELAWDIPRGEVVIADFWMGAGSRESNEFLERFKEAAETLKYHLRFVPHFHVFSMPPGDDGGYNRLCVAQIDACPGCLVHPYEFCAPDPDGTGPVTGADVVNEDLRQLCVWNTTLKERDFPALGTFAAKNVFDEGFYSREFWDYATRFREDCPMSGGDESSRFGYACSAKTMERLGLDAGRIQSCVESNYRSFLQKQVEDTAWSPQALRLNGWRYSGPLDPQTVLRAVCAGYKVVPEECHKLLSGFPPVMVWIGVGQISIGNLISSIVALTIFLAVIFMVYRRHVTSSMRRVLREEVMLEVQSQMADYVPLEDARSGRLPAGGGNGKPISF